MLKDIKDEILSSFEFSEYFQLIDSSNKINKDNVLEFAQFKNVDKIRDFISYLVQNLKTVDNTTIMFSDLIKSVSEMSIESAIDWIFENAKDIDGNYTIFDLFEEEPELYKICLILGIVFGFTANDALQIALNGFGIAMRLKKSMRQNSTDSDCFDIFERCVSAIYNLFSEKSRKTDMVFINKINSEFSDFGESILNDFERGFTLITLETLAEKGLNELLHFDKRNRDYVLSAYEKNTADSIRFDDLVNNSSPVFLSRFIKIIIDSNYYHEQL
ncbi:hypothetical protein [Caldicellulosiruptor acetigenus]|uniref:hypothetical protein n=1 Tax=Caldicellulosiruptor acetigenus TaxID=301953 RepID=UPI00040A5658|nr:hypothetical protein [Caldicellulosiruptor acetigenus]WAM36936.1 hypothetical protein OTK01_000742 [Caldicellulosiruptor acetigenus]